MIKRVPVASNGTTHRMDREGIAAMPFGVQRPCSAWQAVPLHTEVRYRGRSYLFDGVANIDPRCLRLRIITRPLVIGLPVTFADADEVEVKPNG